MSEGNNPRGVMMEDQLGVDKYMRAFSMALDRSGKNLTCDEKTDIYNRAWEAVAEVIRDFSNDKGANNEKTV